MRPNDFLVMPPNAIRVIEAWLKERRGGTGPEDAFFTNHVGGPLSKKQVARIVKDAAEQLALKGVHPHLLRHTMASLLRERGVELDVIRDCLGHESIATTEMYVHAVPIGQDAAAAAIDDL